MADDELPKPDEIEVEFQDLYRHDEEQAYLTLMSQDIKCINFPVRGELHRAALQGAGDVTTTRTRTRLGSFELIASNRIRSDEETLGEIFNGQPYYTDKEPAEDPDFDWVPRKEQVFSDKQLMQLSVWKKEFDEETNEYEPVDLGYKPYGYHQTRVWKKLGYLDEEVRRRPSRSLDKIHHSRFALFAPCLAPPPPLPQARLQPLTPPSPDSHFAIAGQAQVGGDADRTRVRITDPEVISDYYKKQDTIKVLREDVLLQEGPRRGVRERLGVEGQGRLSRRRSNGSASTRRRTSTRRLRSVRRRRRARSTRSSRRRTRARGPTTTTISALARRVRAFDDSQRDEPGDRTRTRGAGVGAAQHWTVRGCFGFASGRRPSRPGSRALPCFLPALASPTCCSCPVLGSLATRCRTAPLSCKQLT